MVECGCLDIINQDGIVACPRHGEANVARLEEQNLAMQKGGSYMAQVGNAHGLYIQQLEDKAKHLEDEVAEAGKALTIISKDREDIINVCRKATGKESATEAVAAVMTLQSEVSRLRNALENMIKRCGQPHNATKSEEQAERCECTWYTHLLDTALSTEKDA